MQRPSPLRTARPVVGPDGTVYPTLAAASEASGRWPSSIRAAAVLGKGWRFATADEVKAASQERRNG